ncbi:hypothetical protein ADIS_2863 [Lunatimonas lonarensis]|uniref:Uncharacterized protein n=1 Tax=Lunatimonas lonarensis TaxID=1232681 RepID=R7ZQT4_9BACT|nr:hypothetical protein ADIS_2863 [Lunatimonas lonarensis]
MLFVTYLHRKSKHLFQLLLPWAFSVRFILAGYIGEEGLAKENS